MTETRGRPTVYTADLADYICEELSTGRSLRSICEEDGVPTEACVRNWAVEDREGFFAQYTRARDIGLDCMADRVLADADGATDAALGRLKMDARRWYLSKMAPKRYGDKVETVHSGEVKVTRVELVGV